MILDGSLRINPVLSLQALKICLKLFLISFMNQCSLLLFLHVVLFYGFLFICRWTVFLISHVPLLLLSSCKPLVPTASPVRISFPTLAFMLPNIIFILYEGHCFYVPHKTDHFSLLLLSSIGAWAQMSL